MYREEKKVEFIGGSNWYLTDTGLVDGLVALPNTAWPNSYTHPLATLGAAKPLERWSSNSRMNTNYLGTLL